MQPSQFEIQREVETLRDIRRRSSAPGSILDPDLPAVSSDSSSSSGYWDDSSSSSHSHESDTSSTPGDDPLNLFWVPARLHPEIAPAEFRAFLKEHARSPPEGNVGLSRSSSTGSTGLGRKRSMLSRQYNPAENDGIENEKDAPIRRNRTSVFAHQGPQLTINDLQKLEELAEEASQSRDPTKLRSVLRRSLSMNIAPSGVSHSCHGFGPSLRRVFHVYYGQSLIKWTTCLIKATKLMRRLLSHVLGRSYDGLHARKFGNLAQAKGRIASHLRERGVALALVQQPRQTNRARRVTTRPPTTETSPWGENAQIRMFQI